MTATNKTQLHGPIHHSKSALYVSGEVFAHHQEHLTVFTVYGSIHLSSCGLVSWMSWNEGLLKACTMIALPLPCIHFSCL